MSRLPNLVEGNSLAAHVDPVRNQDVVAFLDRVQPSCHSDNCDVLIQAARQQCGEWIAYSPSFADYRYVALITNRTVFALGMEMDVVYFRLPQRLHATALATGATPAYQLGANWFEIKLFRSDWPDPDIPFWTLKAYAAARNQEE